MRIAYLECFSGISGDMFMGALIDAGVSPRILEEAVRALDIGARLEISRVVRSGISATKVDVWVDGEKDSPREEFWDRHREHENHSHSRGDHSHVHDADDHDHYEHVDHHHADAPHAHAPDSEVPQSLPFKGHGETHTHDHSHIHSHDDGHQHGRCLTEIRRLISASAISDSAKKTAIAIFEALGQAEAKIHNTSIQSVHFHEVGAVDAMVDIVCAAVGTEALGVDEIVCSPLNVGGGTVKCAHGTIPVPAPATVELLAGAPVYSAEVTKELVTPTGAAIVKILASSFASFPRMKIEKSGYGAGTHDFPGHPNVLRLTIGEATPAVLFENSNSDTITVLEANLDDLNPQVFGYVMDRLFEEGALDAFGIPVQMKKNRPGSLLTVLCKPADADKLSHIIFSETTTLGIRRRNETRQVLARRWERVATSWGEVRIKIATLDGTDTNYAPEYEDCRRIAAEYHVPLKTVIGKAIEAYLAAGHLSGAQKRIAESVANDNRNHAERVR